ncbi:MAG: histidine triad nucleotide-binding protein [Chloroflexota bacterium]|nr:MAG: histidine triad nucleotide-binding protein [Chloroflexota bacterium]
MSCVFCRIAAHAEPAKIIYEDDEIIAFRDAYPEAPVHVLIVPKEHIPTLNDFGEERALLLGKLVLTARRLAEQEGIASAYRVQTNVGRSAGQTIFHFHIHLTGGRRTTI